MRPLVHEPIQMTSSPMSVIFVPGGQAHVFERTGLGGALVLVGNAGRVGHGTGHGNDVFRRGAPGHDRRQRGGVERDDLVEVGAVVSEQRFPVLHGGIPLVAGGCHRPALEVVIGLLVGCDHAGAGTAFDGHVAHGHAAFHGQVAECFAGKLDDVAGAAGGADLADHGQDDVLGGGALCELAVHLDLHVLGFLLDQRLGGQNVLDFGGADAVGQRAEGSVRGGVAVAAHDGGAGQREALFRPDDVHDALTLVGFGEVLDAEVGRVLCQCLDLDAAFFFLDAVRAVGGRDVVVNHGEGFLRAVHLAAGHAQAFKGLRAGDFVHQVAVDVEQAGAVFCFVNQVVVPDLVVQCAWRGPWPER
jgi:hypothetical protein